MLAPDRLEISSQQTLIIEVVNFGAVTGLTGFVVEIADVGLRNAKRLANAAFAPLMTNFAEILSARAILPGHGDAFVTNFFLGRHVAHAHDVAHGAGKR